MADVAQILHETGAYLEGHFLLTSGRHSGGYLEKFRILQHPEATATLCHLVAEHFRGAGVQVVAGPTLGGVILAYEVARQLTLLARGKEGPPVRAIFAERSEAGRSFGRTLGLEPGERVLVVDDILTTGGSVREVLDEVRRWRGEVVGVAVLVDRSGGEIDLGAPLFSCHRLAIPSYPPENCPICARGLPLVKPGGGA